MGRRHPIEQNPVLPERIRELALLSLPGPAGSYDASARVAADSIV